MTNSQLMLQIRKGLHVLNFYIILCDKSSEDSPSNCEKLKALKRRDWLYLKKLFQTSQTEIKINGLMNFNEIGILSLRAKFKKKSKFYPSPLWI